MAAEFGYRQRADVDAVHANRALGHIVETADQVDQRALARAAVADQPDHLARPDRQVQATDHSTVAVAEAEVAQFDGALHLLEVHRALRLRHARHMVEDVEDALGAGGGLLRDRHNPAHRIQTRVEAADIGQEGDQHTHRDGIVADLPDAKDPDHQQAHFGQQRHRGREQRPDGIDAVVDGQIVLVRLTEALDLALFLGEGLDHADAGNGIRQHVGDLGPDTVDLLESVAQAVPHQVDHPRDERQRHQRHQRQPRIDRDQDDGRHGNHQHIGREIEQVERQEDADPIAFRADAGHQVARTLAAEVFERQF
ncbi:hypothetical protein D3C87_1211690 [compost metagenome]